MISINRCFSCHEDVLTISPCCKIMTLCMACLKYFKLPTYCQYCKITFTTETLIQFYNQYSLMKNVAVHPREQEKLSFGPRDPYYERKIYEDKYFNESDQRQIGGYIGGAQRVASQKKETWDIPPTFEKNNNPHVSPGFPKDSEYQAWNNGKHCAMINYNEAKRQEFQYGYVGDNNYAYQYENQFAGTWQNQYQLMRDMDQEKEVTSDALFQQQRAMNKNFTGSMGPWSFSFGTKSRESFQNYQPEINYNQENWNPQYQEISRPTFDKNTQISPPTAQPNYLQNPFYGYQPSLPYNQAPYEIQNQSPYPMQIQAPYSIQNQDPYVMQNQTPYELQNHPPTREEMDQYHQLEGAFGNIGLSPELDSPSGVEYVQVTQNKYQQLEEIQVAASYGIMPQVGTHFQMPAAENQQNFVQGTEINHRRKNTEQEMDNLAQMFSGFFKMNGSAADQKDLKELNPNIGTPNITGDSSRTPAQGQNQYSQSKNRSISPIKKVLAENTNGSAGKFREETSRSASALHQRGASFFKSEGKTFGKLIKESLQTSQAGSTLDLNMFSKIGFTNK